MRILLLNTLSLSMKWQNIVRLVISLGAALAVYIILNRLIDKVLSEVLDLPGQEEGQKKEIDEGPEYTEAFEDKSEEIAQELKGGNGKPKHSGQKSEEKT